MTVIAQAFLQHIFTSNREAIAGIRRFHRLFL